MKRVVIKVEIVAGARIDEACKDLITLAQQFDCLIQTRFADVLIFARPGSDAEELELKWRRDFDR